jgi:hypothetical protein
MSDYRTDQLIKNVSIYLNSYLKGLNNTVSKYYKAKTEDLLELGFLDTYLFLYGKGWGKDFSIAAFNSDIDFFIFFIKPTGQKIVKIIDKEHDEKFGKKWTFKVPGHIRRKLVIDLLGLKPNQLVESEPLHVPSSRFIMSPEGALMLHGEQHGISRANQYGALLKTIYPQLKAQDEYTKRLLSFRKQYQKLKAKSSVKKKPKGLAQEIGYRFEALFRDILEFYGWQPKKMLISGEENDFTAIYEGNHILGEVRWCTKPLNGNKVRAFATKLDPRSQTIGLIISYSGFDEGAFSVARRLSNKTVVFFGKEHIDLTIEKLVDPGEVFSRELRNTYDYLFENKDKQ